MFLIQEWYDDMTEQVLNIEGLKTYFLSKFGTTKAVDGLDLSVNKGEIVSLVGESGSGKSVAGFSILGLVDPPGQIVDGSIKFLGKDLVGSKTGVMEKLRGNRIAMVFQDPLMTLNPVLRIDTQMVESITIHRNISKKEALEISLQALKDVGIPSPSERLKNYPHELSGGMRQRVAIAIALINSPDLVIADEPTTALDVTTQAQILHLIRNLTLNNNTGLIWITHDLGVAAELSDRIAVMYAGRIVEEGPADDVLDRTIHPYTEGLIQSLPEGQDTKDRLFQIPGMTPSLMNLPEGCPFKPRCGVASEMCRTEPPEQHLNEVRFRCHHPRLVKQ